MSVVWHVKDFDFLDSTQHYIKTVDRFDGLVIRAVSQGHGVGRHGRKWEEGEGNLYFSFVVRPDLHVRFVGQLSLLTSVAVQRCLASFGCEARIKWPNDVYIRGKKCAGILIDIDDVRDDCITEAVIGIGINVSSAPLDLSTCIHDHTNRSVSCDQVLREFLDIFSELYEQWKDGGISDIHASYVGAHINYGAVIHVKIADKIICGRIVQIDALGHLTLYDDDQQKDVAITSGQIIEIGE